MDDIKKSKKKDDFAVSALGNISEEEMEEEEKDLTEVLFEQKKKEFKEADEPSSQVRVSFGKFVQMVASHDFERVVDKYGDEDIVMSTNLLTELANAHEEVEEDSRVPLFFIVGLGIGIVITYLLVKY